MGCSERRAGAGWKSPYPPHLNKPTLAATSFGMEVWGWQTLHPTPWASGTAAGGEPWLRMLMLPIGISTCTTARHMTQIGCAGESTHPGVVECILQLGPSDSRPPRITWHTPWGSVPPGPLKSSVRAIAPPAHRWAEHRRPAGTGG